MTLNHIIYAALGQLDEDPADVSEYIERFKAYANVGYQMLVTQYVKPRERRIMDTDSHGHATLLDDTVRRVISLRESNGNAVNFTVSEDGMTLNTDLPDATLDAVCEVVYPELSDMSDEPQIALYLHQAIVDYVCYRHLLSGNLAKQSRANAYLMQFNQTAALAKRPGSGSVRNYAGLYAASDIRNYRQ